MSDNPTRYDHYYSSGLEPRSRMVERPDGDWMKVSDHTRILAEKEAELVEVREMLSKVKVSSTDFDPESQKHETAYYQFEDVWHMGESREKYRHAQTAKQLVEERSRREKAEKEIEALKSRILGWRDGIQKHVSSLKGE